MPPSHDGSEDPATLSDRAAGPSMPSIPGIPGPYRFFFYSSDCKEPMHVHVERDRKRCKFWIERVGLAWSRGFSAKELNDVSKLIASHLEVMRNAWTEHCGRS